MSKFKTKYGYFTDDGKEFVITRPDTPRPWINIMSNGEYGLVVSQTGLTSNVFNYDCAGQNE